MTSFAWVEDEQEYIARRNQDGTFVRNLFDIVEDHRISEKHCGMCQGTSYSSMDSATWSAARGGAWVEPMTWFEDADCVPRRYIKEMGDDWG